MPGARKQLDPASESTASAKRTRPKRSKTVAVSAASAALTQAPPDKCFWVNHGPVLRNLRELREALAGTISDEQFAFHVGAGKNDFATWVADVLNDVKCASSLRRARTKPAALRAVERALAHVGE